MKDPDVGSGRRISRIPRSRLERAWRRAARVGLVVLACGFADAGQAQGRLDEAVDEIAELVLSGANLEGRVVLVRPGNFFEMQTKRSLPLSKYLAGRFTTELGRHGARPVSETKDESRAITLQGRWRRESGGFLLLSVEVRQLAGRGLNEHSILDSRARRVPLADIDERGYLTPDLESYGRDMLRRLERQVDVNASVDVRRYRLRLQPFETRSQTLPRRLGEDLQEAWLPAFTGSKFAVFLSGADVQFDGELHGTVRDLGRDGVGVSLRILDRRGRFVAASSEKLPKEALPGSEEVAVEPSAVRRCAGLAGTGRSAQAVRCYAGVLGEDAGNARALEGLEGLRGTRFWDCEECPEMVVVPSGNFRMGSPESEEGRDGNEGPVHRVTIGYPFAVGVKEVTRGEFARFVSATRRAMGNACWTYEFGKWSERPGRHWRNPGFSQTDEHPVVCVNWNDARAYVRWLSGETGKAYRLLSESEWEYVARAGTGTARYWGESEAGQCRYANGADTSTDFDWRTGCNDHHVWTSPVKSKSYEANRYGLRDVLGNAWEWVEDCWNDDYNGAPADGSAWASGDCNQRAQRGGSWLSGSGHLRSAHRTKGATGTRNHLFGLRVARTLTP